MNLEAAQKALQRCRILGDLDPSRQGLLLLKGEARSFAPEESVYEKDEPSDGTFALLVSGKVSVTAEDGRALTTVTAPDIIGEIAPLSPQGKRTFTVVAVEQTELLHWRMKEIRGYVPELVKPLQVLAWDRVTQWQL